MHRIYGRMKNRLSYWRKKRGLTQEQLADLVGTSQPNIGRLEAGKQELTLDWMQKLALPLGVQPMDLVSLAVVAELRDDVELCEEGINADVAAAIRSRGFSTYRVKTKSLSEAGVDVGAIIVIDTAASSRDTVKTGSVVLAHARSNDDADAHGLILRQFLEPALLTTNRKGRNVSMRLDDEEITVVLIGVAVRGS